jgi:2-(1,2-epoxy-1,2-dihydrophenyl)acetyl-CoA isomerase
MSGADAPELLIDRADGVATLTLNRPDRLNALSFSLMADLADAVADVASDTSIACVILTGAGRGFCAGGDTKQGAARRETGEPVPHTETRIERSTDRLRREMEASRLLHIMPKPSIAMVNGPVAGAGIGLAGACDLRFASETATFSSAFARIGASGDYGSSWFWTHILGTAKAREMFLLGDKLTAAEAHAMGVYNRIYPDADLHAEVAKIARQLADGPRSGWRYMKANLNAALTCSLEQSLDRESVNMVLSIGAHFAGLAKSGA